MYRKTHLWGTEKGVFTAGSDPAPVVATRIGTLGAMICYDLEFPEMVRDVALRGAQIVVAPSNWPAIRTVPGERPPEVTKAQAGASVNRVFVVVADRVGAERGVDWIGGSVVCDVDGYLVARAHSGDADRSRRRPRSRPRARQVGRGLQRRPGRSPDRSVLTTPTGRT